MFHIEVSARQLMADIRSGMSRRELMHRYGLTSAGLRRLLNVLTDINTITWDELVGELYFLEDPLTQSDGRYASRYQVKFDVPIYDANLPEIHGRILDVAETGLGVEGIRAKLDETKTLVILGDPFGEVVPIEFQAICRWATKQKGGEFQAGFQVTAISAEDFQELQRFIRLVETYL